MIEFNHVTKKYDSNIGLDDVSIRINPGDFVFVVGPSGAGKSTFIKLILREIEATSGKIIIAGQDITKFANRHIPTLRRNIGIVFQDFRLLPKKTVYENVAFAMEITHKSAKLIKRQVPQILSLVGISAEADKYPDELSAGEQQRVAIARAIINNPTILIADEPTGNLDPDTAWEIMQLLNQINQRGTTILMVTHAKDIVDRMNKRVVTIENGVIVGDTYGAYDFTESLEGEQVDSDTIQAPANMKVKDSAFEMSLKEKMIKKKEEQRKKEREKAEKKAQKKEQRREQKRHKANEFKQVDVQKSVNQAQSTNKVQNETRKSSNSKISFDLDEINSFELPENLKIKPLTDEDLTADNKHSGSSGAAAGKEGYGDKGTVINPADYIDPRFLKDPKDPKGGTR